jgi:hypothetical protein
VVHTAAAEPDGVALAVELAAVAVLAVPAATVVEVPAGPPLDGSVAKVVV